MHLIGEKLRPSGHDLNSVHDCPFKQSGEDDSPMPVTCKTSMLFPADIALVVTQILPQLRS